MHTPVAFIIFNRPDLTEKVFCEIAKAKPPKLFVIADGPRDDHPDDMEKCSAARAIIDRVDWECEVLKNYSDVNLGCGYRPASGISWVFKNVEKAIILEDDCVPHPTFFYFCEELLEKFRNDERIMQICGNNYQFGRKRTSYSYFFSYHNICAGGWATWRRAWRCFDMAVKHWIVLRNTPWMIEIVDDQKAVEFWKDKFDKAYDSAGNIDYWDFQWTFACWTQRGLSVLPNTTLISNIGFGCDATHTIGFNNPIAALPSSEITFPLQHPQYVVRNREADQFFIERLVRDKKKKLIRKFGRRIFAIILRAVRNLLSCFLPDRYYIQHGHTLSFLKSVLQVLTGK